MNAYDFHLFNSLFCLIINSPLNGLFYEIVAERNVEKRLCGSQICNSGAAAGGTVPFYKTLVGKYARTRQLTYQKVVDTDKKMVDNQLSFNNVTIP